MERRPMQTMFRRRIISDPQTGIKRSVDLLVKPGNKGELTEAKIIKWAEDIDGGISRLP